MCRFGQHYKLSEIKIVSDSPHYSIMQATESFVEFVKVTTKESFYNIYFFIKDLYFNLNLDCLDQGTEAPISYFHRPISTRPLKATKGVVIGITNYMGTERQYIVSLAESLGMIAQDIFAKKDKQGAKKSTHLVILLRKFYFLN